MPKKKHTESPDEQSARFLAEVRRMIADGELSPTDAQERFDDLMARISTSKTGSPPD